MMTDQAEGPSWARDDWPLVELDEVNAGLDPTQATIQRVAAKAKDAAGPAASQAEIEQAARDSIAAMMLIRTYRVRGHLAADLDPLHLSQREMPADLTPEFHGFAGAALDRPVWLGGALGLQKASVREIVEILRRNYCGRVGLEYMHINDLEERRFLQERMEGKDAEISFTPEGKRSILTKVVQAEQWEKFLARKYVGTKRFGLDGGEAMVPALEAVIKYGGQYGVASMVFGMAHRGRLNVLANVMGKPYRAIFSEFAGGAANPEDVGGSGDVKYHLGTSSDREFDGIRVHLSLVPNPSHLEAVDPVVLGKTRAQQVAKGDSEGDTVLPVLLHGDAAFAGQGIVAECLGFSGIPGYSTGGCLHFIINNQVGFTTSPQFGRSSPYPSDVAKAIQAPILHVNGDDPEAVTFCCKLAIEYRQKFNRDIVIDMWCYRRFGHNEGDEPSFTQPLMYQEIRQHPPVSALYAARLEPEGVIAKGWVDGEVAAFTALLEQEFESGAGFDWATAEALAFGTLLRENHPVRLSGQDSGRGTFSQRHAVWVDQSDGHKFIPLTQVGPARFEVRDSPLSEFGVLGFEYGWSLADPQTLVLWEAQFGDFANGAQVIIDQFIAAGEAKWLRASGLVLLLPHGYEGQGPEHSSARPERFLQLCAEDNMQVANCTTPANYYHLLRRQMHRDFRKPLIIMTPKSLLRHKLAVSSLADFTGESHFRRILSDPNPPADKDVRRLVLCTGKLSYELFEARDKAGDKNTAIVRIEQLYPFPGEALLARLKRMTNLEEVIWAQEEPQNQGYWAHVAPRIERRLGEAGLKPKRPVYAGRSPAASPATGLAKRHAAEQAALIADALGQSTTAQRKAS